MKQIIVMLLILGLSVGSVGMMTSKVVQAQQDVNINPDDGTNPNIPGTTVPDDTTGGISPWLIIIPLLALALYFLLRRGDERVDRYENQGYAGTKGGEARRDMDDDLNP